MTDSIAGRVIRLGYPKDTPAPLPADLLNGVIAAHADTRITEHHDAHLAPSYVVETIRGAFPDLGITEETT
jgi:hypothetical protein